jgi:hypothetical protein
MPTGISKMRLHLQRRPWLRLLATIRVEAIVLNVIFDHERIADDFPLCVTLGDNAPLGSIARLRPFTADGSRKRKGKRSSGMPGLSATVSRATSTPPAANKRDS